MLARSGRTWRSTTARSSRRRCSRKWLTPRYKKITDLLRASTAASSRIVDCDGNINCVVERWLEGGVNIMFPLEIRGGTDPYWMREKFGHDVLLMGGVDKTQLIAGKEAIDKEIERITPLVEQGGYIPHVDHRCPPDVTYENYLYYLKRKREAFGIPEPAPWEERRAAARVGEGVVLSFELGMAPRGAVPNMLCPRRLRPRSESRPAVRTMSEDGSGTSWTTRNPMLRFSIDG